MMMRVRITTPRPVAARPSATPRRRTIHNAVVAHKVTLINKDTGATIMGDARKVGLMRCLTTVLLESSHH